MRSRWESWVVAVLLACFCALVFAGTAGARGIDRSFGAGGEVDLAPQGSGDAIRMALGPGGRIYLLQRSLECSSTPCYETVSLTRRLPDGAPDWSYGEPVLFNAPASLTSSPSLVVDSQGRPLVSVAEPGSILLVRLLPGGSLDPSFGEGGRISVGCDCRESHVALRLDGSGHILLLSGRLEFPVSPPGVQARIGVTRLSPDGLPEPGFGQAGWLGTTLGERSIPSAFTPGPDGSVVIAGAYGCCSGEAKTYLVRLDSDGSVDEGFGARAAHGLESLELPDKSRPGSVTALIPLRHGAFDVVGSSESGGYVLRLRRNGGLDRRFGHDGLRLVKWRINAVAPLGGGRLFAVGNGSRPYGGAVVFALKANGGVAAAFSRTTRAIRLESWDPSQVTAGIQRKRHPLLFETGFQFCRFSCAALPRLIRFDPIRK